MGNLPMLSYISNPQLADWAWRTYGRMPMPVDAAVGVTKDEKIVGVALFQNYNGYNVEFSYYGADTLRPGVVRVLARFVLAKFNPARVTISTAQSNKRILRFLSGIGASYEGLMKNYYGRGDGKASTAVRFCLPRPLIEKIARLEKRTAA